MKSGIVSFLLSVLITGLLWTIVELDKEIERMKTSPEQSCYRLEQLNDSTIVFKVDTIKRPDVLLLDAGEL
jgi:hypothetical protein